MVLQYFSRAQRPPHNSILAYQLVFGSNPADNFGWGDEDEDLLFAQDTSLSGQFVANWKLRMLAQEAALKEIANSKLRRILAFNNSFESVDVKVGDEVLFYKAPTKKSIPRWRGPAKVLLIDESGVTLSFQGLTFKVARHCVRRKVRAVESQDTSCEDVFDDLCRSTPSVEEPAPPPNPPLDSLDLYKRKEPPAPGSTSPNLTQSVKRTRLDQDDFDTLELARDTPIPSMATDDQGPLDSFEQTCTQTVGPPTATTDYDRLSHRDLHDLCKQRGYAHKDSKASLCTRLRKMDEVATSRAMSTKRSRDHQDGQELSEPPVDRRMFDKRRRKADAYLNFVANKEILKQHAHVKISSSHQNREYPKRLSFHQNRKEKKH